jgi:glycosyltransferase involved in cell wall biosynthesis
MDVFLFPSLFEGLGLVLVEAQAAGLPCILSNTVPEEAEVVKPLVRRLSLAQPASLWAEALLTARDMGRVLLQPEALTIVENSPFNVSASVEKLERIYRARDVTAEAA